MAGRRSLHALVRHCASLRYLSASQKLNAPSFTDSLSSNSIFLCHPSSRLAFLSYVHSVHPTGSETHRCFSSQAKSSDEEEAEGESEEEDCGNDDVLGSSDVPASDGDAKGTKALEEADAIGYKVIGRVDSSERLLKKWEPVFAVVQIGSHQFKVTNGDEIYTEKLKYCDINDKLLLNKVLMLGSKSQTIIGRPTLPEAAVHAVVEEHALDAKVIIFKKKRRKNYRRTKGHRQELTRLRITGIQGIEKSQKTKVAA